jgi:glucose/arabinose dehydrogenase
MKKYILIILAGTVPLATSCKKKRSEPETAQPPETTTPGTTDPPVNSAIGKILRITTNGKPAPGNPTFAGQADARPELYSMGHRNQHGLAFHPITGDLWEGELGPRGGDEINLIRPGLNYGWPVITYSIDYSGQPIGSAIQQQSGMEQPVYYWDPVVSPSGMTFYRGNRIPEWENNLSLKIIASPVKKGCLSANASGSGTSRKDLTMLYTR